MKVLVAFTSPNLSITASRFFNQAQNLRYFDKIYMYSYSEIKKDLYIEFGSNFNPKDRGYGWWCWKPLILKKVSKKLRDGDLLYYVDSGCHLNAAGLPLMDEYEAHIKKHSLLAFQSGKSCFYRDQLSDYVKWIEQDYNTFELMSEFETLTSEMKISGQVVSTALAYEIGSRAQMIIDKWLDLYRAKFHLMTDTYSHKRNNNLIAHRHDQSAFSLLVKTGSFYTRSNYEIELPRLHNFTTKDWNILRNNPIQARRDLQYRLDVRLIKKISQVKKKLGFPKC
jgi:hypothetical protein